MGQTHGHCTVQKLPGVRMLSFVQRDHTSSDSLEGYPVQSFQFDRLQFECLASQRWCHSEQARCIEDATPLQPELIRLIQQYSGPPQPM